MQRPDLLKVGQMDVETVGRLQEVDQQISCAGL
jgi:hypothetical protein